MHQELSDSAEGQNSVDIWVDFVDNLWDKHLSHLREELYGEGLFEYNPNTGCYGFQEEEEEEASSSELPMAALLKEAVKEGGEEENTGDVPFRFQSSIIYTDDHSSDEESELLMDALLREAVEEEEEERGANNDPFRLHMHESEAIVHTYDRSSSEESEHDGVGGNEQEMVAEMEETERRGREGKHLC